MQVVSFTGLWEVFFFQSTFLAFQEENSDLFQAKMVWLDGMAVTAGGLLGHQRVEKTFPQVVSQLIIWGKFWLWPVARLRGDQWESNRLWMILLLIFQLEEIHVVHFHFPTVFWKDPKLTKCRCDKGIRMNSKTTSCIYIEYPPCKLTASLHLKIDGWKMSFLLGPSFLAGAMLLSGRVYVYIKDSCCWWKTPCTTWDVSQKPCK